MKMHLETLKDCIREVELHILLFLYLFNKDAKIIVPSKAAVYHELTVSQLRYSLNMRRRGVKGDAKGMREGGGERRSVLL